MPSRLARDRRSARSRTRALPRRRAMASCTEDTCSRVQPWRAEGRCPRQADRTPSALNEAEVLVPDRVTRVDRATPRGAPTLRVRYSHFKRRNFNESSARAADLEVVTGLLLYVRVALPSPAGRARGRKRWRRRSGACRPRSQPGTNRLPRSSRNGSRPRAPRSRPSATARTISAAAGRRGS